MRNLKRALSLALASVMLLGMMVVGTSAASYTDVDASDNLEAIEVLKAVGVMTGDENGNFNPDNKVTRNEMAVVMCNLLGLTPGGTTPFTDVPAWAQPYVAACYNNGIIAGISATEFSGNSNVTAVQAGLMVMKALGYFGYQGEFGESWKLAVVKQANEIDLYKGINAYTDKAMTRNEIARMVLNALECTVMVVREEGGMSVDGNGILVSVKPSYDKTKADNREGYDYRTIGGDTYMQLCEKLYGKELKKNVSGASDAFGRTSTQWTYKTSTITTPNAADLTYTKEVKIQDIFADLGKPGTLGGIAFDFVDAAGTDDKCTVDGTDGQNGSAAISTPYNTSEVKLGGNGATVEVYYDRTTNEARLVVVNTYVGKVTKVAKNDDGKYDVTVDVKNRGTLTKNTIEVAEDTYSKDDIVLVTKINAEMKSIALAEKVSGEVTAKKGDNSYIKLDGTQYNKAVKYYNLENTDTSVPAVGTKLTAYVDSNNNLFAVDKQENVKDYLYVIDVIDAIDGLSAKVAFADGTQAKIDITKVDSTEGATLATTDVSAKVFTYTVDDGEYTLTSIGGGNLSSNTDTDGAITKGSAVITDVDGSGTNGTAGNQTVFVDVKNKNSYTGYKNVPSFASVDMYVVKDSDGIAEIVFITAGVDTSNNDMIFYVKSAAYEETKVDGTIYREYTVYVNGAEQKLTTKGMTAAASLGDDDSTLQADTLYVAKSMDSEGRLTAFDTAKSFAVTGDFDTENNGNVTVAKDGVLTISSTTYDKSGASKTTFTYDDKTVFMTVKDKASATGTDSVEIGSVGDIVLDGGYVSGQYAESVVYVLSVEDKTDDTPLATLVMVIVPQA